MNRKDYIPNSDGDFNNWQINVMTIADANATTWGIPPETVTAMKSKQAAWNTAYNKTSNPQSRTTADVITKDNARETYEKALRGFVAEWLANNSKLTDGDKAHLGLNVKSEERRPSPVPSTSPYGTIDFSVRLQHTIHFSNSENGSKAKPEGVHGCEIWIKIGGEPPKEATDYKFQAVDTRTPYTMTFEEGDLGKIVYYRLRWVNTRGQCGPWSNTFNAIVAG